MAEIDILMATYNGERFVAEQIESILSQTFTDWRLIIRDDGSSDNTPAIIEGYAAKYPGKIQVIHDDAVCRSSTKNFFELLKHAEADYVMFSDQDDVWLKWKVEITYDYMKNAERENPGKPVMVFSGLYAVDAELKSLDKMLHLDPTEASLTFKELFPGGCSAGCTQMINRACYEGMGGFQEGILFHDWWASHYAAAFGVIVRVPMALILYRQHGNNIVGAGVNLEGNPGIIVRLGKFIRHPIEKIYKRTFGSVKIMSQAHGHIRAFRERFADTMPSSRLREIDEYSKMFGKSITERIPAIIKHSKLYYIKHHMSKTQLITLAIFGHE